jgi:sugar lactone lactonase YvrE
MVVAEGSQVQGDPMGPPFEVHTPNPYYVVWPAGRPTPNSWGDPGRPWGSTSAAAIDADGRSVWIFDRCGSDHSNCLEGLDVDPIMKFDPDGNLLLSFGRGMFYNPHGLHIDKDGNLWATDAGGPNAEMMATNPNARGIGHQVIKFSPDGTVLMRLGTAGVAGEPPAHLTAPTEVATNSAGEIFVAEGHSGANRISKFAADGTFIMSWGEEGTGPGQFRLPHDIVIDSQDRVFVADRTNYRIQIFDRDGNFIDEWKQFGRPSGLYITPEDMLYVTDSHSWGDEDREDGLSYRKGIRVGSARTGEVMYYRPDLEVMSHANSGGEGIAADSEGNVYSAVVRRLGVEKFTLQPPEQERRRTSAAPAAGAGN